MTLLSNPESGRNITADISEDETTTIIESDRPRELAPDEYQKYMEFCSLHHEIRDVTAVNIMNVIRLCIGKIDNLTVINGDITDATHPKLRQLHVYRNQNSLTIGNIGQTILWVDYPTFRNSSLWPTSVCVDDADLEDYLNENLDAFVSDQHKIDPIMVNSTNMLVIRSKRRW